MFLMPPRPLLITSRTNPRIRRIARLRRQRDRREAGVFVAEGFREVGRAMDAGLQLEELYWNPRLSGMDFEALAARFPAIASRPQAVCEVSVPVLEAMTYLDEPEGIVGVFREPRWEAAQIASRADWPDLWLVAAGTGKPGNLGAMARSAAAAGATGIIAADAEVDAFNPNAIRASTGAVFILPILRMSAQAAIDLLHGRGATILAAAADAVESYTSADMTGPVALVIGAEDRGLPRKWLDAADRRISIPMRPGPIDSLNAATTAAVLLFEAVRQRGR
jgi:TrmH family RNA methyltransferase